MKSAAPLEKAMSRWAKRPLPSCDNAILTTLEPRVQVVRFSNAFVLVAVISATQSACMTTHVHASDVRQVPTDRLLAYQQPAPGTGRVEVTRDAGLPGGGCFLALMYGSELIGRFDPEEHATFYLPVGSVALAAVRDPLGRGLCGLDGGDPAIEMHSVSADKTIYLRMRLSAYRRPWVTEDKAPATP